MSKTNNELSKLLDAKLKDIKTTIEAIDVRMSKIEDNSDTDRMRLIEIRGTLQKMETRLTAIEGRLKRTASKEDTKNTATRKDIKGLEKKFDQLFNFIDKDVMTDRKRIYHIEDHLNLPVLH